MARVSTRRTKMDKLSSTSLQTLETPTSSRYFCKPRRRSTLQLRMVKLRCIARAHPIGWKFASSSRLMVLIAPSRMRTGFYLVVTLAEPCVAAFDVSACQNLQHLKRSEMFYLDINLVRS
mmetsp:Transcript_8112/g.27226  ORF Transcript_8112/g.27226 Transcript_8112/m.27226 type:complete len:120 (+) Transcript_8112:474-833(+)